MWRARRGRREVRTRPYPLGNRKQLWAWYPCGYTKRWAQFYSLCHSYGSQHKSGRREMRKPIPPERINLLHLRFSLPINESAWKRFLRLFLMRRLPVEKLFSESNPDSNPHRHHLKASGKCSRISKCVERRGHATCWACNVWQCLTDEMKWKFNKIKVYDLSLRPEGSSSRTKDVCFKWRCMPAGRMSNMRKYAHKIKQLVAISLALGWVLFFRLSDPPLRATPSGSLRRRAECLSFSIAFAVATLASSGFLCLI